MSPLLDTYILPLDPAFMLEGEYWTIEYEGTTLRLRDSKGLHYLAELLARGGADVAAIDLVSGGKLEQGEARGAVIELIDARARAAYLARIADLDDTISEAEAWNDGARASRARSERETIVSELRAAVGLGGRARSLSDSGERARQSATKAIKSALARITDAHAELGHHLKATIRTGYYCCYRPDPRVPLRWRVQR